MYGFKIFQKALKNNSISNRNKFFTNEIEETNICDIEDKNCRANTHSIFNRKITLHLFQFDLDKASKIVKLRTADNRYLENSMHLKNELFKKI